MTQPEQGQQLALGLIGGGPATPDGYTHFAASRLDGRWQVAAGMFGRDAAASRQTAAAWQIAPEHAYTSWRDLVLAERARLDAVVVLSPVVNRYEIIQTLLKAGMPVICDGALTANLSDARALLAQYNRHSHFVAVACGYCGYPMLRELRRRIRAGQFGQIHQLHIELPQDDMLPRGACDPISRGAQPKDDFIPAICLELGVHVHHLAHFLTGDEPELVNAEFSSFTPRRDIIDNALLWLHYHSGMSANLWMSRAAVGRRDGLRIRLFGEHGSAEWCHANAGQLLVAGVDGTRTILDRGDLVGPAAPGAGRPQANHAGGFIEAYANLYHDLADALLGWRAERRRTIPGLFGIQQATNGLSLLHAARLSSSRRRWERIHQPVVYRELLTGRLPR